MPKKGIYSNSGKRFSSFSKEDQASIIVLMKTGVELDQAMDEIEYGKKL